MPPGIAAGQLVFSWANPASAVTGLLAVAIGPYLAAVFLTLVFLTLDATRHAPQLAEPFRRRALTAGPAVAVLALLDVAVLRTDAPPLLTLLPGTTVTQAAATPAVLHGTLLTTGAGALLLIPSLWWLLTLFQHEREQPHQEISTR